MTDRESSPNKTRNGFTSCPDHRRRFVDIDHGDDDVPSNLTFLDSKERQMRDRAQEAIAAYTPFLD